MTLSAPYQPHGRLKARPAAEIVEYVNDLMMRNSLPAFAGLIRYHLAYVVMLAACGVISSSTAGVLLRALRRLASKGTSALCLYPARYEELQPAIEAWLVDEVGVENGGQLNAGRSRQECQMVAEQLI